MDEVKIKVVIGSKTLDMSFPEECGIEEWVERFKTILFWATFHPDTIKEVFPEEV